MISVALDSVKAELDRTTFSHHERQREPLERVLAKVKEMGERAEAGRREMRVARAG